jgi:hypothetical protein
MRERKKQGPSRERGIFYLNAPGVQRRGFLWAPTRSNNCPIEQNSAYAPDVAVRNDARDLLALEIEFIRVGFLGEAERSRYRYVDEHYLIVHIKSVPFIS